MKLFVHMIFFIILIYFQIKNIFKTMFGPQSQT
jgi:hypothetical protein